MIIYNRTIKSLAPAAVLIYLLSSFISCNKAVTVSSPDTPPPNGFIFINSNPRGFHIYLDKKQRRRATPDSLMWLNTGTYLFTLKKDLFFDTSFTVSVVEGEKHSVFVDFTKNPSIKGKINCISYPSNAEIFINDSSTGLHTPNTLSAAMPGYYYIKFRIKDYRDDSILIAVSSGNTSFCKSVLVDTALWLDYTTSNSGIPSDSLSCITIDKNNVIWAGSYHNGYFSFNGTTWRLYYNSFSTIITCITSDVNNIKYIGTIRGMIVRSSETAAVEYGFKSSGFPNFHINAIAVENNDSCFVGTDSSITQFPGWADFTPFNINEKSTHIKQPVPITALAVDANNNIWAGFKNSGIGAWNSSNVWRYFTSFATNIINDNVTSLAISPNGEIWAGFDRGSIFGNGLSYFNGSRWNNVYPISVTSRTNIIFIDKNNIKWVGTNQGLVKFSSPSNATLYNYDNTGLNITNVTGIAQDSYGNTWIATGSGLFKYKGKH